MAIQTFGICDPGPGVSVALLYDDGTLLVQSVQFQNLSSQNGRVTLTVSGTDRTTTLDANTPLTTRDVSGLGVHMVATAPPKGSPSIGLPAAISVHCAWPA